MWNQNITWLLEAGWTQTVVIVGISLFAMTIVYFAMLFILARIAPRAEIHVTPVLLIMCSVAVVTIIARHPGVLIGVLGLCGVGVAIGLWDHYIAGTNAARRRVKRNARRINYPLRH
jgi:hypothetical protein